MEIKLCVVFKVESKIPPQTKNIHTKYPLTKYYHAGATEQRTKVFDSFLYVYDHPTNSVTATVCSNEHSNDFLMQRGLDDMSETWAVFQYFRSDIVLHCLWEKRGREVSVYLWQL